MTGSGALLRDVFISYSQVDRGWVEAHLLPSLREAGLTVLVDYLDFTPGLPSVINVERAIAESRHTVVVLTPDWAESQWTQLESILVGLDDPAGMQRKLIPLLLKPCTIPPRIRALTAIDLRRGSKARYERELEKLIRSLAQRPAELPPSPFPRRRLLTRRRLLAAGLFAPVLGLAPFLLSRSGCHSRSGFAAVAVLPFDDTGGGDGSDYLADGLCEGLITRLSQLPGMRVIPWLTVKQFRGSQESPQKLARRLGVDALVTGTLRRSSRWIKMTIALIDGASGLQSWADELEEPRSELFALERKMGLAAASRLLGRLSGAHQELLGRPPARSAEAYELYLRGRALLDQQRTRDTTELAADLFRKALALDADLAEAQAGMGDTLYERYYQGWNGDIEHLRAAEASYLKARALAPALASAYRGLVRVYWQQGRTEEFLKIGQEMSVLDPENENAEYAETRAEAYFDADLFAKAAAASRRAIRLDPANRLLYATAYASFVLGGDSEQGIVGAEDYEKHFGDRFRRSLFLALAHHNLKHLEKAEGFYREAIRKAPDDHFTYLFLGVLKRQKGQAREATRVWLQGAEILRTKLAPYPENPRLRAWLSLFHGYLGDREALAREEAILLHDYPLPNLSYILGKAHLAAGEPARAEALFRDALSRGTLAMTFRFLHAEGLDAACDHPGIRSFLIENDREIKRLGLLY